MLGMVNDAAQLIMQCLACAAPSPSRDQALPLSPTGVGCFILLLARGARLAHGAHEQVRTNHHMHTSIATPHCANSRHSLAYEMCCVVTLLCSCKPFLTSQVP